MLRRAAALANTTPLLSPPLPRSAAAVRFPWRAPKCEPPNLEEGSAEDGFKGFTSALQLQASGTQNFTCTDGKPEFSGSLCSMGNDTGAACLLFD